MPWDSRLKIVERALKRERAALVVSFALSLRNGTLHVLSDLMTGWRISCLCVNSKVRCKSMSVCTAHIVNFTMSVADSILYC